MMRALPLYAMALEASFDEMTLAEGTLPNSKIAQRMKEGHPPMRPEPGYVVFVSFSFSFLLFN